MWIFPDEHVLDGILCSLSAEQSILNIYLSIRSLHHIAKHEWPRDIRYIYR